MPLLLDARRRRSRGLGDLAGTGIATIDSIVDEMKQQASDLKTAVTVSTVSSLIAAIGVIGLFYHAVRRK